MDPPQIIEKLREESILHVGGVVLLLLQPDVGNHRAIGIEPRIDALHTPQAAKQQAGAT